MQHSNANRNPVSQIPTPKPCFSTKSKPKCANKQIRNRFVFLPLSPELRSASSSRLAPSNARELFTERYMLLLQCTLLMFALKLLLAATVVWYCKAQQVLPCTGSLIAHFFFVAWPNPLLPSPQTRYVISGAARRLFLRAPRIAPAAVTLQSAGWVDPIVDPSLFVSEYSRM